MISFGVIMLQQNTGRTDVYTKHDSGAGAHIKDEVRPLTSLIHSMSVSVHCTRGRSCTATLIPSLACSFHIFYPQVAESIKTGSPADVRVPVFDKVPDEGLMALFELALSCTAQLTVERPKFSQIVAELEKALQELTGEANRIGERIDKVVRGIKVDLTLSLDDELSAATHLLTSSV